MYYTLQGAVENVILTEDRATRLKVLKKILEETELAMINQATKAGVVKYQINSGQSIISIQQQSYSDLIKAYRAIKAMYNEIVGVETGGNLMYFRDYQSNKRRMGEL